MPCQWLETHHLAFFIFSFFLIGAFAPEIYWSVTYTFSKNSAIMLNPIPATLLRERIQAFDNHSSCAALTVHECTLTSLMTFPITWGFLLSLLTIHTCCKQANRSFGMLLCFTSNETKPLSPLNHTMFNMYHRESIPLSIGNKYLS